MDNQKKDNKVLLIILIILVLILIGIGIYLIITKDDKKIEKANDSPKEDAIIYDIVKGNEYQIFTYNGDKYELFTSIKLDYPQIISNDKSISNLNSQIKDKFEQAKKLYETKYKISSDNFCKFCYYKDSEYYCSDEIIDTNYLLKEDNNYLLIRINNFNSMACSSGDNDIQYYTFDKNNKKLLDNAAIMKVFNYDNNSILNKLKQFIENTYKNNSSIDLEGTKSNINNSKYFISNNNLYIVYRIEDAISYNETVMYDGNSFKVISEEDIVKIFNK